MSPKQEGTVGTSTLKVGPLSISLLLPSKHTSRSASKMSDGSLKSSGKWLSRRGQEHHKKGGGKKMTGHSVWRSAISECLSLTASVKNMSRLLQQFPGLKIAEEASSLGNIVLCISEMVLNCLNGSAYDVQCSWTYSRKSWVIQKYRDYDGNIGFILQ